MRIVDNTTSLLGDDLKSELLGAAKFRVAAAYFSVYAFDALKSELGKLSEFEFIFTTPTFAPNSAIDRIKKERREFFIPIECATSAFSGGKFEIKLRNKMTQRAIARECADWIRRKARFKSNVTSSPMQQFAHVQKKGSGTAYMPLSGFTVVDLGYQRGDAISNYTQAMDEPQFTQTYLSLFDQIWHDQSKVRDVTTEVLEHIEAVYQENPAERVYFMVLFNLFSDFLSEIDEDVLPKDRTGYQDSLVWKKLFNFQRDAAVGVINKLETYNGCILADSVGLGKTFTALAVVKYYELRNKDVLVLCPKRLADNWRNYNANLTTNIFAKDRFRYDVLCHTDLSRTSGESFGMRLDRVNWGNYDLVVIDESHNFRNNDVFKDRETRYQRLMDKVIKAGVKTKVLMLSATPVNNRFTDLRNQLALAYEGQSDTLSKNLKTKTSVEEIFRRAQTAFNVWSMLPPDQRTPASILCALDFDFFELLDAVTIARSRKHIETFYDTADIGKFPTRLKPLSHHLPITHRPDVIGFNKIFLHLSALKLAVYAPVNYIQPSRLKKYEDLYDTKTEGGKGTLKQADREKSLQALMTINLLKRLESSVHAFRITLGALSGNIARTLKAIARFEALGGDVTVEDLDIDVEAEANEDDDFVDFSVGKKIKIDLADMDIKSWKYELSADHIIIQGLITEMERVAPADDAKLQHLIAEIAGKIASPLNPGNRKVIVFTAYADTANYLFAQLAPHFASAQNIHTGLVIGSGNPKTTLNKFYDFQSVLTLFAPRAKEKDKIMPDDLAELDILIGTDCISEGQNLQDCDYLINYDIHWNPVRIVQRFGRIDRIGSPNTQIQLSNCWPDLSLDEYINLKERVENRMHIVDMAGTGEDNVLTSKSSDVAYRKDQLQRLQNEVIELEDVKTGISITDLGLNDFRMDLLNYLKTHDDLPRMAHGLHTVIPADPKRGLVPGVIFALRNIHDSVNINQQNRLHPYYLIYIGDDGRIVTDQTQVKRLLDLIRTGCKGNVTPFRDLCAAFNAQTRDGRDMSTYSGLLNDAIRSMIEVKEERDIDSLFSGGHTTALTQTIAGLDDFELIAFIVIRAP